MNPPQANTPSTSPPNSAMRNAINLTRRSWASFGPQALAVAVLLGIPPVTSQAATPEHHQTAQEVATLFRAARKVLSANQTLIDDANTGDKGLNGVVIYDN